MKTDEILLIGGVALGGYFLYQNTKGFQKITGGAGDLVEDVSSAAGGILKDTGGLYSTVTTELRRTIENVSNVVNTKNNTNNDGNWYVGPNSIVSQAINKLTGSPKPVKVATQTPQQQKIGVTLAKKTYASSGGSNQKVTSVTLAKQLYAGKLSAPKPIKTKDLRQSSMYA